MIDVVQRWVSDLCRALENIDQEARRAEAVRAVRQRELQLSGIVDTALDAIITGNERLEIVLFNRAATRMFRVSEKEVLGRTIDRFIPLESRAAHRGYMVSYAGEGVTSRLMGRAHELTGLRADGETFPMEASISRAGEDDGLLMTMMARPTIGPGRSTSTASSRACEACCAGLEASL